MFEVKTHRTPEGLTVALIGDLDTLASQELDGQLEGLVAAAGGQLVVDLGGLTYLNSTGIRTFIRLDKLLKARGQTFRFAGVSDRIFRIFRYCGLDAFFTFERRVAAAEAPVPGKGAGH